MRQFSVIFELSCTEIDRSVLCIRVSLFDQCADQLDHSADLLCRQRMCRRRKHVHIRHIFFAFRNITLGNLFRRHALFICFFDDLVIHIGKVGYIVHIISFVFKISPHRIKYDHRTRISDVDIVIYGRSAYIHTDFSFLQRYKFFFLFGHCII